MVILRFTTLSARDCTDRTKLVGRTKLDKACPVNAGHYMAFKHHISFATGLAANFGCN